MQQIITDERERLAPSIEELERAFATQTRAVVAARGLTRTYGKGDAVVHALRDVDIDIAEGRLTAVMGPSGSGKSTLMHILAGLDRPTAGRVQIDGDGDHPAQGEEAHAAAPRQDRLHLPELQPAGHADRGREHRAAALAGAPQGGRGLAAHRHRGRRPAATV